MGRHSSLADHRSKTPLAPVPEISTDNASKLPGLQTRRALHVSAWAPAMQLAGVRGAHRALARAARCARARFGSAATPAVSDGPATTSLTLTGAASPAEVSRVVRGFTDGQLGARGPQLAALEAGMVHARLLASPVSTGPAGKDWRATARLLLSRDALAPADLALPREWRQDTVWEGWRRGREEGGGGAAVTRHQCTVPPISLPVGAVAGDALTTATAVDQVR
jgi:hypothetical protein